MYRMPHALAVVVTSTMLMSPTQPVTAWAADAPVADAAMHGDGDTVRALLADGGDVNTAQGDGMTALHWAAFRDDVVLAAALIEAVFCAAASGNRLRSRFQAPTVRGRASGSAEQAVSRTTDNPKSR